MSGQSGIVQHLDPTKDKHRIVGIALAADGHNAAEVLDFYHKSGTLPEVHPVILYEVKSRGVEGDKLSRALISLDEIKLLTLGTHLFHVSQGNRTDPPNSAHIESARSTLEKMGNLKYEARAMAGDGREVRTQVDIRQEIEYLLGYHLATPIKKS